MLPDVGFGSKADKARYSGNVRFTPQRGQSADVLAYRFVPKAHISELLRADAYHSDRSTLLAQQLHRRKMTRRASWPKELASEQPICEWSEPSLAQDS